MKAEAMRDDENVFDVAYEGMGGDEPSASAADVKVSSGLATASWVVRLAAATVEHSWHQRQQQTSR
jgi:hypothetical protein